LFRDDSIYYFGSYKFNLGACCFLLSSRYTYHLTSEALSIFIRSVIKVLKDDRFSLFYYDLELSRPSFADFRQISYLRLSLD